MASKLGAEHELATQSKFLAEQESDASSQGRSEFVFDSQSQQPIGPWDIKPTLVISFCDFLPTNAFCGYWFEFYRVRDVARTPVENGAGRSGRSLHPR